MQVNVFVVGGEGYQSKKLLVADLARCDHPYRYERRLDLPCHRRHP